MYKFVSNKKILVPMALHNEILELVVEDVEKRQSSLN